ncbi:hypothetical protein, partial [Priestia megaterium]|uniref:hypothetical protein n=1 Tax=Priestia megaterium TaxID=1404 RepID=UPI0030001DD8
MSFGLSLKSLVLRKGEQSLSTFTMQLLLPKWKKNMEKEYEKALEIRNEGLKLLSLNNEELASLYAGNGGTYLYLKDYNNATLCFDKAFELVQEEKFPYDEQYIEVIDSYVKANRKEDALKLVESLLQRQSYHKKFRKLE